MSKWEMIKLSDMFTLQMGKTPSRDNPAYWNGDKKWVSISDLGKISKYISNTKECISDIAISETGIKITPKDTVIMSFKLSIGKTAITCEDIYTNEAIMSFIDKGIYEFDLDYIYYLFSGKDWNEGTNKAVMGITLNKATLSQIRIPLPPINLQKQIAKNLDKVTRTIDLCNAILEKLDLLVKARFVEMFGDAVENPKKFPIYLLSELSELITKGASPSWQGFSYTDDNTQTLFVTSENVREGYIDISSPKYIEDSFNDKQKRSILKKGDFLINIVGASIGRAAQFNLDCKANINQAAALVRIKDTRICDKYLLIYLNSEKAQQMYNSMKSDTGRANLSLQDIGNLLIILPPIDLQNQFADFVKQTEKSKSAVKQVLEKAETLKKALMQEYFG